MLERAYNDPAGINKRFMLNGIRVAERILDGRSSDVGSDYGKIFKKEGWEYTNRWNNGDSASTDAVPTKVAANYAV